MIISVNDLKKYITTDVADEVLEARLQALELSIRGYTHNHFHKKGFKTFANCADGKLVCDLPQFFKAEDTVEISCSYYNEGLYTVSAIDGSTLTLNTELLPEDSVLVYKIEYPADVKMGVVDIMKWKLKNEAANSGDTSKKDIQSETISRHSVTYATDSTESDIDERFGVPRKYMAFLKGYIKPRF